MRFAVRVMLLAFVSVSHATEARSFHLIQIERIIGGVAGDLSAQAIQLRLRFPGETLLQFSRLRVYDAAGENPVTLIDFETVISNGAIGAHVLVTSLGFASYTSPKATSDFTLAQVIPDSYLAAGRITYEGDDGTIYWSLAYGGAAYIGPTDGASFNDADGEFGPPFDGPLPTATQPLVFTGSATDGSTANQSDYVLSVGAGVFTNNNGDSFFVTAPIPIPTVSEWSLATMALLLLTAGTALLIRRRSA